MPSVQTCGSEVLDDHLAYIFQQGIYIGMELGLVLAEDTFASGFHMVHVQTFDVMLLVISFCPNNIA